MWISEEGLNLRLAHLVITAGNDVVQIYKGHLFRSRHLCCPTGVIPTVTRNLSVLPNLPGDQRTDDRGCFLSPGIRHVLTHVPAERVNHLVLVRQHVIDLFLLCSHSLDGSSCPAIV